MRANVGDRILIKGHRVGEPTRPGGDLMEELLLMKGVEACAVRIAPGNTAAADAAVRLALRTYVGGASFGEAAGEALRSLAS
jgi:hypothetical protein